MDFNFARRQRLGRIVLAVVCALILAPVSLSAAEGTIRVGLFSMPFAGGYPWRSASVSETHVHAAIYDSLTQLDGNATVQPMLATSWRPVDELTWTFDLRSDVTFSNGEPFDAAAVVAVIDYLRSPAAQGDTIAREANFLAGARALAPYAVEITTDRPSIILPRILAGIRIAAPAAMADPNSLTETPIGSGPFKVTSWSSAEVALEAFDDSWRAPRVERMVFRAVPDPAARLQALMSGALDLAFGMGPDDRPLLQAAGHDLYSHPGGGVYGLSFVTVSGGPIADRRVRQALNHGVDKQAIVEVLLQGAGTPASQATPSVAHGYDPDLKPFTFDQDKARALLQDAGYQNGIDFTVEAVIEGNSTTSAVLQFVAAQLAEIGVRMEIRPIPVSELFRKATGGGWDGQAFSMDFDTFPTFDAMRPIPMHSCLRAVPWYCDREIMPAIEKANTTFDAEARLNAVRDILRHYRDDPPSLFLYETVAHEGVSRRLLNYQPRSRVTNYHELELAD